MYKISTFVVLIALISLIGYGAGESSGTEPATKQAVRPYEVTQLYGSYVKNPQGEYLGRVEDFIIEKDRITYLIITHGGFVGMGGKLIAVPFEACSFDPMGRGFLVNVSRERLRAAPAFLRSTDLASKKWAEEVLVRPVMEDVRQFMHVEAFVELVLLAEQAPGILVIPLVRARQGGAQPLQIAAKPL